MASSEQARNHKRTLPIRSELRYVRDVVGTKADVIIPASHVARAVTADEYQQGLSAFHSATAGFDLTGVGWNDTLVSSEHSDSRTILMSLRTRRGTLRDMLKILRLLALPVWFFVRAELDGITINPSGPEGDNPRTVYTLREELTHVYDREVPFERLQEAKSRAKRRRYLFHILGDNRKYGVMSHAVTPMFYTKYALRSKELSTGFFRFWFDARVLYLYGIRESKVFVDYLGATRAPEHILRNEHEVVWDIPKTNMAGNHRPIPERHVQLMVQFDDYKGGLAVYRQMVPILNMNAVITNLLGTLRIGGRCTKDFVVCCLARIWMEVAGHRKVSVAWVYAQAMALSGIVSNTTTARELHGKSIGHYGSSGGGNLVSVVMGYALSGSSGTPSDGTYQAVVGST